MTTETYTINRREGWEHLPPIAVEIDVTDAPSDAEKLGRAVKEAYRRGADLRDADLRGADVRGADFSGADLEGADLRGANFESADFGDGNVISPELNRDALAAVAREALATPDRLNMHAWHICATTHCIAGWAVHLAGERGKALEGKFGPHIAGALLLGAPATDYFYEDDATARAWLSTFLESVA